MSGPGERRNGRGASRRELVENEMYDHAVRLFAERGFAGTSLQDIADAMGVTRPALYYYVKSKDELLAKLAADVAGGSAAEMAEIAARTDLDALGKLHAIARLTVVRLARQPDRFRLLIRSEAELPPSSRRPTSRAGARCSRPSPTSWSRGSSPAGSAPSTPAWARSR